MNQVTIMRRISIFPVLLVAAVFAAPLTQVASADQPQQTQQQQAMSPNNGGGAGYSNDGSPYGSDATLSPAVGD